MRFLFLCITVIGALAAGSADAAALMDIKPGLEGRYAVGMARTPFTPRAGEPVTFEFLFIDAVTGAKIDGVVETDLRIRKAGTRVELVAHDDVRRPDATYTTIETFPEPGLYDIDVDFWLESDPDGTATDISPYMIEVVSADAPGSPPAPPPEPLPEPGMVPPYAPYVPGIVFVFGLLGGAAMRSAAPWSCRMQH